MAAPGGVLSQYSIDRTVLLCAVSCSRLPIGCARISARAPGESQAAGMAVLAAILLSSVDVLRGDQINAGRAKGYFSRLEQAGTKGDRQSLGTGKFKACLNHTRSVPGETSELPVRREVIHTSMMSWLLRSEEKADADKPIAAFDAYAPNLCGFSVLSSGALAAPKTRGTAHSFNTIFIIRSSLPNV